MRKSRRYYVDFNEFVANEPDIWKSLTKLQEDNDQSIEDIDDMESLVSLVCECYYDSEESVDSCYINRTYMMGDDDEDKWTLEVVGQSYRKDMSVCEEQMVMAITVIDHEMQEQEKVDEKAKKREADVAKWQSFYENKSFEELKSELLNYKFPTKF